MVLLFPLFSFCPRYQPRAARLMKNKENEATTCMHARLQACFQHHRRRKSPIDHLSPPIPSASPDSFFPPRRERPEGRHGRRALGSEEDKGTNIEHETAAFLQLSTVPARALALFLSSAPATSSLHPFRSSSSFSFALFSPVPQLSLSPPSVPQLSLPPPLPPPHRSPILTSFCVTRSPFPPLFPPSSLSLKQSLLRRNLTQSDSREFPLPLSGVAATAAAHALLRLGLLLPLFPLLAGRDLPLAPEFGDGTRI